MSISPIPGRDASLHLIEPLPCQECFFSLPHSNQTKLEISSLGTHPTRPSVAECPEGFLYFLHFSRTE